MGSPQRASHIYRTAFFILQNRSPLTLKMQSLWEVHNERPTYTEQPSLFLRTEVVLLWKCSRYGKSSKSVPIYRKAFFISQDICRPTLKLQSSWEVLKERPIYTEQPSLFLRTYVFLLWNCSRHWKPSKSVREKVNRTEKKFPPPLRRKKNLRRYYPQVRSVPENGPPSLPYVFLPAPCVCQFLILANVGQ